MATFDLKSFDTISGSETPTRVNLVDPQTKEEITIKNEDGTSEPLWVEILGPDSKKYKTENNKIINSRITANKKGGKVTAELMDQENKKLVAAVITGWSPKFVREGAPFLYSAENAKLFVEAYPPIYEQLNDFLQDRGNFVKN